MPLIPYVIDKSGREERAMDIYSRLLKDRIIFLGSQVNDEVANSIVAQMLFLQSDDPKADIHPVHQFARAAWRSARGWRSTTRCSSSPATWPPTCIGLTASMERPLLTAGTKWQERAACQQLRGS